MHATNNYDGQLTGNRGIHARFERDLVERFEARLTISPVPPRPITNARDFAFDALLASYTLVDSILTADTDALAGKDLYDDDYFEKFFAKVRPVLERRLAESITATAGLIMGAWEQAGRGGRVGQGGQGGRVGQGGQGGRVGRVGRGGPGGHSNDQFHEPPRPTRLPWI